MSTYDLPIPPGDPPGDPTSADWLLRRHGPLLKVQIEVSPQLAEQLEAEGIAVPRPADGVALLDTGASISGVDNSAIQHLGIRPIEVVRVWTPGGEGKGMVYPVKTSFPGTALPSLNHAAVLGVTVPPENVPSHGERLVALIGREVLAKFVMTYDGPQGRVRLEF